MTEIVENKENIPIKDCSAECKHLQENDTGKNICIPCAMTIEDWQLLETLDEESVRLINAHGLLTFLGFTIIEGELFHESDFEDVDIKEMLDNVENDKNIDDIGNENKLLLEKINNFIKTLKEGNLDFKNMNILEVLKEQESICTYLCKYVLQNNAFQIH